MRWPRPALLAIIIFWSVYVTTASYSLYQATTPVSRVLLLVLGSYAAVLVLMTAVLLPRARPTRHGGDRNT